ncbi:proline iminopeptidase [Catenulispora acidiphila DSM 44928]|uniref:Proline iminopeptidase n=2 Tax=Catenulispora TaxID=414878 RepID=C7Q8L0_CATAD|nr:proline iminopeptidase [Catenulispora acidiphila DSM 44928]
MGPYATGFLDVGDGNRIYYEELGNPDGKPAVNLHGGPGSGSMKRPTKAWDPEKWRVIRFDQRGCGLSTPSAADPATDMSVNTTQHLIRDIELLREHLGIEKWLVKGGSWGAALALLYAQAHPERVTEMIIPAVTTTRPEETDWLYHGARRLFPEAWDRFRNHVPEDERDGNLLLAYGRLVANPDRAVREAAAAEWMRWEDTLISQESNGKPGSYSAVVDDDRVAFVRICAHYFGSDAWLEPDQVLRNVDKLRGIPAVLVHGRHDLGSPVYTAWELAQAWPDAKLVIIEDSGHTGSEAMGQALNEAAEEFSKR